MRTVLKLIALFAILAITACSKFDVVGNDSIRAFNDLLQSAPQLVSEDEENNDWSISAPDNSVRFSWSKNFAESSVFDVMLEFAAAPFIAAGLDPAKLPDYFVQIPRRKDDWQKVSSHFIFKYGMLAVGTKLGNEKLNYNGEATPLTSYEQIVKLKRAEIGYHMQMDHYGINLGNGNMFEWAKNLTTNDKDIVFVLDPEPFIKAGVNPNNIEGWLYAQVTVDDKNGKPIQVYKFLKPFNLL
jgi:hypothetical protein